MDLFAVEKMCRIINISSSSFYKWDLQTKKQQGQENRRAVHACKTSSPEHWGNIWEPSDCPGIEQEKA